MRHSHYQDHERIGQDFVHDPIVADAQASQAAQVPFQRATRQRVFG